MSSHTIKHPIFLISLLCLGLFTIKPASAQVRYGAPDFQPHYVDYPPQRGRYGGGFIEKLMGGREPDEIRYREQPVYGSQPGISSRVVRGRSYAALPPALEQGQAQGFEEADDGVIRMAPSTDYQKQVVDYNGPHKPGTIIIDTPRKFLFLVQSGGKALRYGIGVGRPGFEWAGVKHVSRKAEWPDWRPPAEMLKRRPDLPEYMEGGPENPLGARALYLGSSLYRIHGTNEPHTIGQAVSSGCIRMLNKDVIDLYGRAKVGTKVVVI